MSLEIKEVDNKELLKQFIYLPAKIHQTHTNWVPPVYMDEWTYFNPRKNKAFAYSSTVMYLAFRNGRPVGRIMGIINHKYNEAHREKDGRFCFLEAYDEYDVAEALLVAVESWAKSKGMIRVVGPLGFSDKDPQGMLIEGYQQPVVIASNCNFPYMVDFMNSAGYKKKVDLVVYSIRIPDVIPEFYHKISERAFRNRPEIKLVQFRSRREMKKYVKPVLYLVNETFRDIYGFSPLEEKEMDEFASRYLMVLDPRFLKVLENEKGEVVAFVLGMPDIGPGIIRSKGRVFPLGFIHILRSQKSATQLNLLLGAVREDYRNGGLDTVLGVSMLEEARKGGFKTIDSHLELETNLKVRAEMEKMQGKIYKRFRIYQKELSMVEVTQKSQAGVARNF